MRASSLSGLMAAERWYGSLYSGGDWLSMSPVPSCDARWVWACLCATGSCSLAALVVSTAVLLASCLLLDGPADAEGTPRCEADE